MTGSLYLLLPYPTIGTYLYVLKMTIRADEHTA